MNIVKEALLSFISENVADTDNVSVTILNVEAVDLNKRTLDGVDLSGNIYKSVSIAFVHSSIFICPKIGSNVLALINFTTGVNYVFAYSEVEAVELVIDNTRIEADKDGCRLNVGGSISANFSKDSVCFNGGGLGGLVRVADLTSRLNIIEKDINTLKSLFKAGTVTPQDGGKTFITSCSSWAAASLSLSKRDDYENKKVTQ